MIAAAAGASGLSPLVIQVVIGVVGGSGVIGAFVALAKLKPDVNSAAITQSQGAIETMSILLKQLEEERNGWRDRALTAEKELDTLGREAAHAAHDPPRRGPRRGG